VPALITAIRRNRAASMPWAAARRIHVPLRASSAIVPPPEVEPVRADNTLVASAVQDDLPRASGVAKGRAPVAFKRRLGKWWPVQLRRLTMRHLIT
jgi:hypothetical protein